MTYIQRLLDSAAPMAPAAALSLAPAQTVRSPVLAADQRLGVFADLHAPPGPLPVADASGGEPGAEPPPPVPDPPMAEARLPDPVRPAPRAEPVADPPPARPSRAPSDRDAGQAPLDKAPPRQEVSPLQRLAESAPLPDRRPVRAPEGDPPAAPALEAASLPPAPEPALPPVRPRPLPETETSPFRNPAAITPDQFRPAEAERPAEPPPHAATLARVPPAPRPQPAPPQPAPLQPAADAGPSPFARLPDLPPPPPDTRAARPEPAAAPPPRIVERIQEVPKAPPAPPKAMTAAAQSVIGPLGQRRGRWQPRQDVF